jgi:hypothetical protein
MSSKKIGCEGRRRHDDAGGATREERSCLPQNTL